jgi:hypothetical protein
MLRHASFRWNDWLLCRCRDIIKVEAKDANATLGALCLIGLRDFFASTRFMTRYRIHDQSRFFLLSMTNTR